MSKKKKKPTITVIPVFPGIEIVAKPDANTVVLSILKSMIEDHKGAFLEERVAEELDDDNGPHDQYSVAQLLISEPDRLERIAKIIADAKAVKP